MFYVIGNYWRKFIHKTSKHINNEHKETNDLLKVIITLGKDDNGDETVLKYIRTMKDTGKRTHVLKHSQGVCVVTAFDKIQHEGSIWTGYISVLSLILHKSIFIHFVDHGKKFYDRYITSDNKKVY